MCECGMNCSTLNLQNAYELELLAIDRLKLKRASRFEQATRIWARASASRCEDLKARAAFSVGRMKGRDGFQRRSSGLPADVALDN